MKIGTKNEKAYGGSSNSRVRAGFVFYLLFFLFFAICCFLIGCEQPGLAVKAPEEEEWEEVEEGEEAPVITGIAVLSLPDTTIYGRDMEFDPAGLVVAWT